MLNRTRKKFSFREFIKSRIGLFALCVLLVLLVKAFVENMPILTMLYESIFLDSYTLRNNLDLAVAIISLDTVSSTELRNQLELGDWVYTIVFIHGVYSHDALLGYSVAALMLVLFYNAKASDTFADGAFFGYGLMWFVFNPTVMPFFIGVSKAPFFIVYTAAGMLGIYLILKAHRSIQIISGSALLLFFSAVVSDAQIKILLLYLGSLAVLLVLAVFTRRQGIAAKLACAAICISIGGGEKTLELYGYFKVHLGLDTDIVQLHQPQPRVGKFIADLRDSFQKEISVAKKNKQPESSIYGFGDRIGSNEREKIAPVFLLIKKIGNFINLVWIVMVFFSGLYFCIWGVTKLNMGFEKRADESLRWFLAFNIILFLAMTIYLTVILSLNINTVGRYLMTYSPVVCIASFYFLCTRIAGGIRSR